MPSTRPVRFRRTLGTAVAAASLVLSASAGLADTFTPPAPHVDKPLYAPTQAGMEHFIQDELQKLIAGQEWTWNGMHYRAVRLHRIDKAWATQAQQANRDYDAPMRGWCIAILHVEVDGRLLRAKVKVNTSYVWQPAGWAWEQVLLYLGNGDSYDFVTHRVV